MKHTFTLGKPADYLVAAVLVLVPFHAFLTIWGSQLVGGGYAALRLWDDVLLVVLMGIVSVWLAREPELRRWLAGSLLIRLLAIYAVLTLLLGAVALTKGEVTATALGLGLLMNLRYLAWFVAVLIVARRSDFLRRWWPRLLLFPAAIVVFFATLQYTVLPHDFLAHFGYNEAHTIAPIETINHNPDFIRVQSTLRGANPLGAYLVVVLSALGVLLSYGRRRAVCAAFGAVALFALFATGSRSAWIGAAIALGVIAWLRLRTPRRRLVMAGVLVATLLGIGGLFLLAQNNTALQNHLLHTQENSTAPNSSNEGHASALADGVHDVLQQPFGAGPGTAGPASYHNGDHTPRIAENYYLQIAQETGWLGLALFAAILTLVGAELYRRAGTSWLALTLFGSFAGLAFVNLLSHAWSDDTLAFTWWGLAGIALALPPAAAKAVRPAVKTTVKKRETDA